MKKLGREGDIAASFRRAVEIDPRYAEASNSYGAALRVAGRIDEAIAAYQRAPGLCPRFLFALNNLAVALIIASRPDEALDTCELSLEMDPGSIGAFAAKSVALSELGNREALEVLVYFDRYIHPQPVHQGEGFADLTEFNSALARHVFWYIKRCAVRDDLVSGPNYGDISR